MTTLAVITWVAMGLFVLLIGRAMALYSGGTWLDATSVGHRFWTNFLCDLMQPRALDGKDNARGARLSRAAMLSLGGALLCFWQIVPAWFPDSPVLTWVVRLAGLASSLGLGGVVAFPSQKFPQLHGVFVLAAGGVGLGAAIAATAGLLAAGPAARVPALIGLATLVVGALDAVCFAQELVGKLNTRLRTTVLQRLATVLALIWMLTTTVLRELG